MALLFFRKIFLAYNGKDARNRRDIDKTRCLPNGKLSLSPKDNVNWINEMILDPARGVAAYAAMNQQWGGNNGKME